MELDYYLFKHKISQRDFAVKAKVDPRRLCLYVHKKANPSLLTAVRISKATDGKVTPEELIRLEDRL